MKTVSTSSKTRKKQDGYALMIVIFITTLILIGAMSISLRVLTEGRRQKEQEMIWRGNQYVRGIKLYYQKFGRFPTSLDDLTKPS
ncbi:MAG: type II secretion system protein, partial [Candidatus Acidiferrum sp.]